MNKPPDIKDLAATINRRSHLYKQALTLKEKAFNEHFKKLPKELQRDFIALREEYFKGIEGDQKPDPNLKTYYRRAAVRFHPDSRGDNSKVTLFHEAVEAYRKGDLLSLQILVLQDMAAEFDGLSEEERGFLSSQYQVMEEVAEKIFSEGLITALAAADFEKMSDNMFRLEIEEACKMMANEIKRRGNDHEGPLMPP